MAAKNLSKSETSKISRRRFLQTTGGAVSAVPAILGADEKSGLKPPVVGSGDHEYEVQHDWGELPSRISYGNTHGVKVDSSGNVYVHFMVHRNSLSDHSIVVFDADGKFVTSWGGEFAGGAHGLHLSREGGDEFLYFCDIRRNIVVKTDLQGNHAFTLGYPSESRFYRANKDKMQPAYKPANLAIASNGDIYVADGYGSSYVIQYDKEGNYKRTFGGGRTDKAGDLNVPHGIVIDNRGRDEEVLVADRSNHRLQYFSLDGKYLRIVDDAGLPCHFDIHGNGDLVIPDLARRVTLLDKQNQLIAHLGEGLDDWRERRKMPRDEFLPGQFICPHGACFDREGNIFVVEWVEVGRVTKMRKIS